MRIPPDPKPGADDAPTVGPQSIEQYHLLRELGAGGMGVVWLARDTRLEREVAIKVLKPGTADRASQRLLREARSAARLSHPNVVSIFHILEQDRQICIVMELLGRSLSDEVRETGPMPWLAATRAVRDAADGLAAAHAAGLVHRDVKPSNLLRGGRGDVKVADFGLVDSPDAAQLTATGAVLGTPGYMAPEQCRGEVADARSDVYGLGCTYYHLLTGHPPFEADDSAAVMARQASDPFPDARRIVLDLPDSVCHIIATACRKDPRLRYETAAQMLAELETVLAPPAEAPTPPAGGRLRVFVSSPGDVAEERVAANKLVRRLSDEYADRLWIEPVFWEHEPLLAHDTFQSQIPRPSESEIVVCILWSRLGTRLPAAICRPDGSPYASGTEFEFEDAVEGRKKNGYPDLLVYRKTAKPMVDIEDKQAVLRRLDQKEALDGFIQKWFFHGADGSLKAAFHTFDNTAKFEQVLEEHLRKLIARRLPADGLAVPSAKPSWTTGSPFRGLQVFDYEHAPIYFGRTQAVADVLAALRASAAAGRAFVLVVGVSGGGKSSLIRAGLLPLLVQPGVIEGVGLWRRAVVRPADGDDPIRSLAAALLAPDALPELAADGTTAAQLAEALGQDPAVAVALVKGALSQAAAALAREQTLPQQPETRLVLAVDQLEELFTLPQLTLADRQRFIAVLSALARGGKVWVVATLRGDFYHRCFELPELVAIKEGTGQFDLPLPTPAEIGQMVRQPARAAGLSFEEDPATKAPLDELLREAASASPESLPLLEFALEELYQRKTAAGLLTCSAYRELGGVEGALAQRAESVHASLTPDVQATLPRVMRALVNVGAGSAVARRQAPIESVAPTPAARAFVDAFVSARLFSADRGEQGQASVRVAHEALLRNWPRVVQWLEHDKELLIVRARVSAAAARWEAEGKPGDLLLGEGKPLAEAENLAAVFADELSPVDRALIAASKARRTRRRAAVAVLLAVMVIAGVTIGTLLARRDMATKADFAVKRLIDADPAQVTDALRDVAACQKWADPLLREENAKASADSRAKLRTSMALLPVEPSQLQFLSGRLLNAAPYDVPAIRDALFPYRDALIDKLWSLVLERESVMVAPQKGKEAMRLRAAAALAKYDPRSVKWSQCSAAIANDLASENPVFLGIWSDTFRPVKNELLDGLADAYRDPGRPAERSVATHLLADYAADQPRALANLVMDADDRQFGLIYPRFVEQAASSLPILAGELDKKLSEVKQDEDNERLAKRQANAAVALLRMNQPAKVWKLLKHSKDPRARSYLIDRLAPLGAEPEAIVRQLNIEPDVTIRRALILSLGGFKKLDPQEVSELPNRLLAAYQNDPDPGVHDAVEWLLRLWNRNAPILQMNKRWADDAQGRAERIKAIIRALTAENSRKSPQWYVNSQGQMMAVVPGPVEFVMGSPVGEAGRHPTEIAHKVRIGRMFAIAAKQVTIAEYARFDRGLGLEFKYVVNRDQPAISISWYMAAAYCNWLSQQDGIPEDQWDYELENGQVARLKEGYLGLEGYRLPTEAEMEYATRAGAVTSRFYGETDELLPRYAWYLSNSEEKTWPVGSKKPNDLGLFDTLGNVWCWCQEAATDYPDPTKDEAFEDQERELNVISTVARVLRGCCFIDLGSRLRSASRNFNVPTDRFLTSGIRPARTLRSAP